MGRVHSQLRLEANLHSVALKNSEEYYDNNNNNIINNNKANHRIALHLKPMTSETLNETVKVKSARWY